MFFEIKLYIKCFIKKSLQNQIFRTYEIFFKTNFLEHEMFYGTIFPRRNFT